MWLCLNNAFLSIVAPKPADPESNKGRRLLVRARRPGDIEAIFPSATVATIDGRDYQFRAYIDRKVVGDAIAEKLTTIGYTNFKGSVDDHGLHDAYMDFWHVMAKVQPQRPYSAYSTPRPAPGRRPATRAAGKAL